MSKEIDVKELVNWKMVSLVLSGNPTYIRKNKIPKLYRSSVNLMLLEYKFIFDDMFGNIYDVVIDVVKEN